MSIVTGIIIIAIGIMGTITIGMIRTITIGTICTIGGEITKSEGSKTNGY